MIINVPFDVTKIMVGYNNYELFTKGYYELEENANENLDNVVLPNSVLISQNNYWIDANELQLLCGYDGSSPLRLKDFINQNAKKIESPDELYPSIYKNNVVVFNFNENKLQAYNSNFSYEKSDFVIKANKEGKLVFLVGGEKIGTDYNEQHINDILLINELIETLHNKEPVLENIKFIGNRQQKEFDYYAYHNVMFQRLIRYNLILEFKDFEIWVDYIFSDEHKNIQYSNDFKDMLSKLNVVSLDDKYNVDFLKQIDKTIKLFSKEQSNQDIEILNE